MPLRTLLPIALQRNGLIPPNCGTLQCCFWRFNSCEPQYPAHDFAFGARCCEIVERPIRHANDVSGDERRAFGSRNLGVLQAILPFIDRPAVEIVLGKLREDLLEIDLTIAERAVSAARFSQG